MPTRCQLAHTMIRPRTASGGSEEAARDTARPRTEDLEDGVPLPLRAHGLETLRDGRAARRPRRAEVQDQARRRRLDGRGRHQAAVAGAGPGAPSSTPYCMCTARTKKGTLIGAVYELDVACWSS